jgi:hypothetical protein
MTSSPDIDPTSMELPDRRSDYAPPQPLAVPQRTMVGLAPPPPVLVAPSATTTPVGIAPAPLSRPALQVVPEPSAIALEPPEDRTSEPELDSIVPRKRKGVVVAVMGVAVALIAAVGVRALFVKRETPTTAVGTPAHAIPTATPPAPVATAPVTAVRVEPRSSATAEPAGSAAPASAETPLASSRPPMPSDENSALAAASVNVPTAGAALAAKAEPVAHQTPTKAAADTPKPHTPQRVEEPKRTPRAHAASPAHHPAPTRPPVSPPLPGGGAIVRQSPF